MPSSLKDFKILAQLGKGSYGSVMKVERIVDGQIYALKEVNIRRLSPRERRVPKFCLLLILILLACPRMALNASKSSLVCA